MSLLIWATHTLTLSYTWVSPIQEQTSLLAFPRFVKAASLTPNLDSSSQRRLLRKRQDNAFRCDYLSTTSRGPAVPQATNNITTIDYYEKLGVSSKAQFH